MMKMEKIEHQEIDTLQYLVLFHYFSILLINLHRYDYGGFYPMSSDGSEEMIGEGRGKGYNVNIAWNYVGTNSFIASFFLIE